ncbi:hypothetical protein JHK84_045432 [Glycine max]|nr:hypothetical protein JHK86_045381 [Glycine max]KAG4952097.1 hypothetical protein JHK85_045964 [Glycine max]KAG5108525.1 hypothetical protein JHK84_045432 [Glycine max]
MRYYSQFKHLSHFLKTLTRPQNPTFVSPRISQNPRPLPFHARECSSSSASQSQGSEKVAAIVDELMGLTLLEVMDLVEVMREKRGVNELPIAMLMVPGMGVPRGVPNGGGGGAAGVAEVKAVEKTVFDVKLEGFDAATKIKVIKEVRTFTSLGLKEAKDLVEKVPAMLKKGVTKEEAESIIAKMKEVGAAGFATVAVMHPLDVVRTRFQVNDGRVSHLPIYKNTAHAVFAIARSEGLRGLYAGFLPGVLGSTISWGLYFFFYDRAKQRYARNREEKLSPGLHLASAAEAGALVSFFTNPVWLVKTRLQLQTPLHQTRPYSGVYDAFRTIMREEGFSALYRGIVPGLFLVATFLYGVEWAILTSDGYINYQVSHGAIQFTAYEELRKVIVDFKSKGSTVHNQNPDKLLNSVDYAVLGATSKLAAVLLTYPFQVIRARLQQRPSGDGVPRYMDTLHVVKETARFEGIRGFYKGITANLLKNAPASSITFIVYENVLKLLKPARRND